MDAQSKKGKEKEEHIRKRRGQNHVLWGAKNSEGKAKTTLVIELKGGNSESPGALFNQKEE